MVSEDQTQCRFCSVAIDPGIAELVADRQEKTNKACSDASYLKTAAIAMHVFLVVGLVWGWAYLGFVATFFVVAVLLCRWQLSFGNLLTNDPDYAQAKRSRNIALILLIVAIPLGLIVNPFFNSVLE